MSITLIEADGKGNFDLIITIEKLLAIEGNITMFIDKRDLVKKYKIKDMFRKVDYLKKIIQEAIY
jgi:hypothetical protein